MTVLHTQKTSKIGKFRSRPFFVSCTSVQQPAVSKKPRLASPDSWQQVVKSGTEQTWKDQREADFQVSLRRWHDALMSLSSSLIIVQQLMQFNTLAERLRMLRDIFWRKAPATLRKRVNSFTRFVAHLNKRGVKFPGTELDLYKFLDGERIAGATPSRIQSIIQSLVFVQHVMGVPELCSLTSSRRCLGVSGCRDSGPKRQADPLRLSDLVALHGLLEDCSRELWDRCMAGMVLLTVYSRSRWNDIQQAEGLLLDFDQHGLIAYAELKISEHKTKHSSAFRDSFLHACAPGVGVVADNWLTTWTQVRSNLGISFDKGHPTMPAPPIEGEPGMRPLSTAEMKEWTVLLLTSVGQDLEGRRVTSHSCKCTLLSWCSKRGLPWEDRLLLGGHTSSLRSAVVYSRDSLGRPLRLLEHLLMEVRAGRFLPDATRSGRFPGIGRHGPDLVQDDNSSFSYEPSLGFGDSVSALQGDDKPEGPALPAVESLAQSDDGHGTSKDEMSERSWSLVGSAPAFGVIDVESGEDSGSDVVDTTSSSSDESGAELNPARRPVQRPRVPDELKLIQHKKLKTLHLMETQNQRVMLCGRTAETDRYDQVQETRFDTPCCHVCWRKIKEYA